MHELSIPGGDSLVTVAAEATTPRCSLEFSSSIFLPHRCFACEATAHRVRDGTAASRTFYERGRESVALVKKIFTITANSLRIRNALCKKRKHRNGDDKKGNTCGFKGVKVLGRRVAMVTCAIKACACVCENNAGEMRPTTRGGKQTHLRKQERSNFLESLQGAAGRRKWAKK